MTWKRRNPAAIRRGIRWGGGVSVIDPTTTGPSAWFRQEDLPASGALTEWLPDIHVPADFTTGFDRIRTATVDAASYPTATDPLARTDVGNGSKFLDCTGTRAAISGDSTGAANVGLVNPSSFAIFFLTRTFTPGAARIWHESNDNFLIPATWDIGGATSNVTLASALGSDWVGVMCIQAGVGTPNTVLQTGETTQTSTAGSTESFQGRLGFSFNHTADANYANIDIAYVGIWRLDDEATANDFAADTAPGIIAWAESVIPDLGA